MPELTMSKSDVGLLKRWLGGDSNMRRAEPFTTVYGSSRYCWFSGRGPSIMIESIHTSSLSMSRTSALNVLGALL